MNADPVDELRQLLAGSPQEDIARRACSTFLTMFESLGKAFEGGGVEPAEAEQLAHGVICGLLDSFGNAGDAMSVAVVTASAAAAGATRH